MGPVVTSLSQSYAGEFDVEEVAGVLIGLQPRVIAPAFLMSRCDQALSKGCRRLTRTP